MTGVMHRTRKSLLDVGAGDGGVTAGLAPMFDSVTATEISSVLAWKLYARYTSCSRGAIITELFD